MSCLLCSVVKGRNAAVHLKRRLSCQDTGIPQWTQIFIGWRCSAFLNMNTSSVKLLPRFSLIIQEFPEKPSHTFSFIPSGPADCHQKTSTWVTPLPLSTLCRHKRLDRYQVKLSVSAYKFTCHSGAIHWITNALEGWDQDDRMLLRHKLIPECIFLSAARSDWLWEKQQLKEMW